MGDGTSFREVLEHFGGEYRTEDFADALRPIFDKLVALEKKWLHESTFTDKDHVVHLVLVGCAEELRRILGTDQEA